MNIWEILESKPTKNKREIKRIYGRLLAKYHPEEFPEKFEEIQKAYERALFYASYDLEYDPFDEIGVWVSEKSPDSFDGDANTLDQSEDAKSENPPSNNDSDESEREISPLYNDLHEVGEGNVHYYDLPYDWDEFDGLGNFIFTEQFQKEEEERDRASREAENALFRVEDLFTPKYDDQLWRDFFTSETFLNVKENPYFIEGLVRILSRNKNYLDLHVEPIKRVEESFETKGIPDEQITLFTPLWNYLANYNEKVQRTNRIIGTALIIIFLGIILFVLVWAGRAARTVTIDRNQWMGGVAQDERTREVIQEIALGEREVLPIVNNKRLSEEEAGSLFETIDERVRKYLLERTEKEWATRTVDISLDVPFSMIDLTYYSVEEPEIELTLNVTLWLAFEEGRVEVRHIVISGIE